MPSKSDQRGQARNIGGRKRVQNPVDQKDPTDQGVGGRDPDDYPAEGAVPVGEAPVHRTKKGQGSIPRGIKKEEP